MAQIPNQTVIIWVLLGFLLAWMVIFAVLALRSNPQNAEWSNELPTPANTFPVTHAHTPMTLHMIATQQMPAQLTQSSQDTGEMSTFPVA
ncbi:MAG: hypothetical protein ACR2H5_12130 [Ktedonobacteraceae bacterium]